MLTRILTLVFSTATLAVSAPAHPATDLLEPYRAAAEKRWEKAIADLEARDKSEQHPPGGVLVIGSSSVRMWKTIADDLAPLHAIQRGYGGAKLSDVAVFTERLVAPHDPRAIVFFVANDISGSPQDKTAEKMVELFAHIRGTCARLKPGVPVFYIDIRPAPSRAAVWPNTKRSNELMKDYCESQPDTHFIATSHEFLTDDGSMRPDLYGKDRLHLNPAGYVVWSRLIKAALLAKLETKEPAPAKP